jgi:Skp family chaperone for outer membrane proteins
MGKLLWSAAAAVILTTAIACTQHKVEVAPVEVKPIHITIDVNVKVDRALDDYFGDIDAAKEKID